MLFHMNRIKTKTKSKFTQFRYTSKCVFPYWARVERASNGGAVSKSRCLRSEPSWMWENRYLLK